MFMAAVNTAKKPGLTGMAPSGGLGRAECSSHYAWNFNFLFYLFLKFIYFDRDRERERASEHVYEHK